MSQSCFTHGAKKPRLQQREESHTSLKFWEKGTGLTGVEKEIDFPSQTTKTKDTQNE